MPEIHCSACDAIISPGSQTCPGCGLQLTAQAVPAVYVEEARFSLLQILVIGAALLIGMCYLLEHFGRH